MADRVQVLKWEAISQGGSSDDREPTPINPQQDAVECAGIYLQDATNRDTAAFISRHSSGMWQSNTGLLLPAGAAGVGKAPLKLQPGIAQTIPENGAIEDIDGDVTWVKGGVRKQLNDQTAAPSGGVQLIRLAIGTADVNSTTSIPTGAKIMRVYTKIGTGYTVGTTIDVTVGAQTLQASTQNDPVLVGLYSNEPLLTISSGAVLHVDINGASVGSGEVICEYCITPLS